MKSATRVPRRSAVGSGGSTVPVGASGPGEEPVPVAILRFVPVDRIGTIAVLVLHGCGTEHVLIDEPLIVRLGVLLDTVERSVAQKTPDSPIALVVCSDRPRSFVVGADVKAFFGITDPAALEGESRVVQNVLTRIERLSIPSFAVLNGLTLGGGLEIAVACTFRVADANLAQLGFPEIKLGVLPGAGGCVRLPHLVGLPNALDLILSSRSVRASEAKRMGLVDAIFQSTSTAVAPGSPEGFNFHWLPEWSAMYLQRHEWRKLNPPTNRSRLDWPSFLWPLRQIVYSNALSMVNRVARGRLPAPYVALQTIFRTWTARSQEDAMACESEAFATLASTMESKCLNYLFLSMEASKKYAMQGNILDGPSVSHKSQSIADRTRSSRSANISPPSSVRVPSPSSNGKPRVIVIGAGHMGSGIAQSMLHNDFEVVLMDSKQESLTAAVSRIRDLFDDSRRRRRGGPDITKAKMNALTTSTGSLGSITLRDRDIVFEAIFEEVALKRELLSQFAIAYESWWESRSGSVDKVFDLVLPESPVFASNTSSIPLVEMIPEKWDTKKKVFFASLLVGMHHFNPIKNVTPTIEIVYIGNPFGIDHLSPAAIATSTTSAASSLSSSSTPSSTPVSSPSATTHTHSPHSTSASASSTISSHPVVGSTVPVPAGWESSSTALSRVARLAASLGKTPVLVSGCSRGFVVNRVFSWAYELAAYLYAVVGIPFDEVDAAFVKFGFPSGPFRIVDSIGFHTALSVARAMRFTSKTSYFVRLLESIQSFRPDLNGQHKLRGSGDGFYRYDSVKKSVRCSNRTAVDECLHNGWPASVRTPAPGVREHFAGHPELIAEVCVLAMANEAVRLLHDGLVRAASDIDTLMVMAVGFPVAYGGLMAYVDWLGISHVVERLTMYADLIGDARIQPCEPLRYRLHGLHGAVVHSTPNNHKAMTRPSFNRNAQLTDIPFRSLRRRGPDESLVHVPRFAPFEWAPKEKEFWTISIVSIFTFLLLFFNKYDHFE